ncbi:hypothetical protein EYF80_032361 [Liparis tanakae]|uniref:Uncharacterized protein n=1 Tax=Liparis tanakae TaxID=230148 RepID=A0A4Z2GXK7_9TELE|nr:hypothetical protein EYF80_032361 [Liparis tanakae]
MAQRVKNSVGLTWTSPLTGGDEWEWTRPIATRQLKWELSCLRTSGEHLNTAALLRPGGQPGPAGPLESLRREQRGYPLRFRGISTLEVMATAEDEAMAPGKETLCPAQLSAQLWGPTDMAGAEPPERRGPGLQCMDMAVD